MEILWSDFALDSLKDIYLYYDQIAGKKVAKKIKDQIFNSVKQLKKYPKSGQIEEMLIELGEGHRYLVAGNYKIIYKKVKEGILITDVFDTRQNPKKINNPKRRN